MSASESLPSTWTIVRLAKCQGKAMEGKGGNGKMNWSQSNIASNMLMFVLIQLDCKRFEWAAAYNCAIVAIIAIMMIITIIVIIIVVWLSSKPICMFN